MPHHCVAALGQSVRAPRTFWAGAAAPRHRFGKFLRELALNRQPPLRTDPKRQHNRVPPLALDRNNIGLPWKPRPRTGSAGESECRCCRWAEKIGTLLTRLGTTSDISPVARPCTPPAAAGCTELYALHGAFIRTVKDGASKLFFTATDRDFRK
jgi:hypothetical protein